MFFLLIFSIFIPFMLRKPNKYEVSSVEAISNCTNVTLVHSPQDLPDNIDFFIITIVNGHDIRKIGRHSITVPKNMRVHPKFHLKQALLLYKSGRTEEIKDVLKPYVGYDHNFDHHEVGLQNILKLEGFENAHSISMLWSGKSFLSNVFLTSLLL